MGISKALQSALHKRAISYNSGYCDDSDSSARFEFHLFDPGHASACTVLFHGTGNDALFGWEELILDLLAQGRAVFTFDLPGHGQNSSTQLSEVLFTKGLAQLPRILKNKLPEVKNWEAIGYSLGAIAALQLASHWTRLVLMALPERVVLSSAFAVRETLSFLRPKFWQEVFLYGPDARFPAFGPVRRARFPIRLTADIDVSYPRFVDQLLLHADAKSQLLALQIPVLLIYGERDELAKPAYGRTLRGEFRLVSGANHFLLPLLAETRSMLIAWLTSPQHPAANSVPR